MSLEGQQMYAAKHAGFGYNGANTLQAEKVNKAIAQFMLLNPELYANAPPSPFQPQTPNPHQIARNDPVFVQFVARYKNDPEGFVRNVLGAVPDPWQSEVLELVRKGSRRISIRSGHGTGKTTVCSWIVDWHGVTKFPQKTAVTAPSAGQLFDALVPEIKSWIKKLPTPLQELFDVKSDRIDLVSAPESSFMTFRTASKDRPEALAGVHSDNVLLVVDEASGVPEEIFTAAGGSMSGPQALLLMIGNPTRLSGLFYESHHKLKKDVSNPNGLFDCVHISGLDSSRVDPDYIRQIKVTWGEDSDEYRVRVLGEFPKSETHSLIPMDKILACMQTPPVYTEDLLAPFVISVDCARMGEDRTVIGYRRNKYIGPMAVFVKIDTMEIVGRVIALINEEKERVIRHLINYNLSALVTLVENKSIFPAMISVDGIGLGAGVVDRLNELGYNVQDVVVSRTTDSPAAYKQRDEYWWRVRQAIWNSEISIYKDTTLAHEITTIRYTHNSKGQLVIWSKEQMKAEKLRSPDLADALMLLFAVDHTDLPMISARTFAEHSAQSGVNGGKIYGFNNWPKRIRTGLTSHVV